MPKVPGLRKGLKWLLGLTMIVAMLATTVPAFAQGLTPTNEWVNFYGTASTLNGAPLPVGATVTAYDPNGVLCGSFTVHTPGSYGVMPVYRDDTLTAADEGAAPGDTITFRINGVAATAAGPGSPVWTSNGNLVQVELQAGGAAVPTNTAVPPTNTPIVPTATTQPGAPTATATQSSSSTPEWVNFYGLSSTLDGAPLPVGAVVEAWSAGGIRCGSSTVSTAGSYGLLACQRAALGQPGVQPGDTVYFTINGRAARPMGPDSAVWTLHGERLNVELEVAPITPIPATNTPIPTPTTPGGTPSAPEWVNFYGISSTYDGATLPVGAVVDAYAPDGTKCGTYTVTTIGQYGVLPCYKATAGQPGAQVGDTISFRVNNRPATALGPDAAVWGTSADLRHVELQVLPLTPMPATNTPIPTATATSSGSPTSPEWVNFYGTTSVLDGGPLPVGAIVVAWSPDGVQCGSFTVSTSGSYGVLACLGSPIGLPGAHPGDPIYFTINGRAALTKGPDSATWTTNGELRHVELEIPFYTPTPTPTCIPGSCSQTPTPTVTVPGAPTATPTTPAGTPTATTPAGTPTATTPAGTATTTPVSGNCQGIIYEVRWGDWLYKIARYYGVSVADILYCNPLPDPNCLIPGQKLTIPGVAPTPTPAASPTPVSGLSYTVLPGDTLSCISYRFGVTVKAIMDANGLVSPDWIVAGQKIIIPGATPPAPPHGTSYVVKWGDTLWGISLKYNVSLWNLAVVNNLYYPYIIYAGQTLIIP